MKFDWKSWLRQPTTIHGLGALAALAAGMAASFGLHIHDAPTIMAVAAGGYALPCMAMNDHSAAPSSVEKLVVDAVTAAATQHIADALPALVNDGMAVFRSLTATPQLGKSDKAGGVAAVATAVEVVAAHVSAPPATMVTAAPAASQQAPAAA